MSDEDLRSQRQKFEDAALQAGTDNSEAAFDLALIKVAKARPGAKVCPECHHVFQGSGWDGIDSHWKAKHGSVMPYADAWPLIRDGKYRPER